MKKIIITLLALAAFAFTAKAQLYVGGTAGLGLGTVTSETVNLNWNITPEVGYDINDMFAAGVFTSFGCNTAWSSVVNNMQTVTNGFAWSLAPYFRYKFGDFGKLSFLADAIVAFGTYSPTVTQKDKSSGASLKQSGATMFTWGISVAPGLKYTLNTHWSLICHFASIGYNAIGDTGSFSLTANNGCNFGAYYSF